MAKLTTAPINSSNPITRDVPENMPSKLLGKVLGKSKKLPVTLHSNVVLNVVSFEPVLSFEPSLWTSREQVSGALPTSNPLTKSLPEVIREGIKHHQSVGQLWCRFKYVAFLNVNILPNQ